MPDKYREAGYDLGELGFGARPAILVVDLHLAFTDPQYALGRLPMVQVACNNTATLLALARTKGVPVAKCYTAYGSLRDMPRWKIADVLDHFYYGDPSNARTTRTTISRSPRTRRRCSSTRR
jgi:maleamate amidohydrolase